MTRLPLLAFLAGAAAGYWLHAWRYRQETLRIMRRYDLDVTDDPAHDLDGEDPYLRDLAAILERERW